MKTKNGSPLLFCNIGWMERYEGLHKGGDEIHGGGKYVREKGRGDEICNFVPIRGSLYGWVQPAGEHISLERLGGSPEDKSVSGVTVVWTAKRPEGRTSVVGWYKNATVYREKQRHSQTSTVHKKHRVNFYRIKASAADSTLLPVDARTCEIPRQVKGGMGQANVWYADDPLSKLIVTRVLRVISGKYEVLRKKSGRVEQQDQERKARVEMAAIRVCCDHFERLGYAIKSVEKDNVGWDLEAILGKTKLLIEAKGLSGSNPSIELTPNEFRAFSEKSASYRLGIVVDALSRPRLLMCRYSKEREAWIEEGDSILNLDVITKIGAIIKIF